MVIARLKHHKVGRFVSFYLKKKSMIPHAGESMVEPHAGILMFINISISIRVLDVTYWLVISPLGGLAESV